MLFGRKAYSNPGLAEVVWWQRLILPLNHRCGESCDSLFDEEIGNLMVNIVTNNEREEEVMEVSGEDELAVKGMDVGCCEVVLHDVGRWKFWAAGEMQTHIC
jgi:hypothetical protein